VFTEKVREFRVTVDVVCDMSVYNPFDFFIEPYAEYFPFEHDPALVEDLKRTGAAIGRAALEAIPRAIPTGRKIKTIDFPGRAESRSAAARQIPDPHGGPAWQTPEETLGNASGSCRDSRWLLVQILRNLGFAARFVSVT